MHVQERCADKAIRKGTMNRSYSPEDRSAAAIGAAIDVHEAFAARRGSDERFGRALDRELEARRPGDGHGSVDLHDVVVEIDRDELFLRDGAFEGDDAVAVETEVEQALAAGHGRRYVGAHDGLGFDVAHGGEDRGEG